MPDLNQPLGITQVASLIAEGARDIAAYGDPAHVGHVPCYDEDDIEQRAEQLLATADQLRAMSEALFTMVAQEWSPKITAALPQPATEPVKPKPFWRRHATGGAI